MKKRILVYSVDAMVCEDVDALRNMPNFRTPLSKKQEVWYNNLKRFLTDSRFPSA